MAVTYKKLFHLLIDRGIPTAVTNNNHLTEENIVHIVDEFVSRADVEHFARCVPYEEIVIRTTIFLSAAMWNRKIIAEIEV